MNRGVIINGEVRDGQLSVYQLTDWPDGEPMLRMHTDPMAALQAQGLAGLAWISGTAASKRLAKKLGVKYRMRAPGGGRRKVAIEEKLRVVSIWLTPAQEADLYLVAKQHDKAAGVWVAEQVEHAKTLIAH